MASRKDYTWTQGSGRKPLPRCFSIQITVDRADGNFIFIIKQASDLSLEMRVNHIITCPLQAIKKKKKKRTHEGHVEIRDELLIDVQMTSLWVMEDVWRKVHVETLSVNVTPSPEIQDCVTVVQSAPSWVMDGLFFELLIKARELVTVTPVLNTQDCVTATQIASPWRTEDVCHAVQPEKVKLTVMIVLEAQNCVTVVQIASPWVIKDMWHQAQIEGSKVSVSNAVQPQYRVTDLRTALPWIVENVWRVAKEGELKLTVMAVLEAQGCVRTVKMGSSLVMDAVWLKLRKNQDVVKIKPMLKSHDSITVTQRGPPWLIEDEWCKMQLKKIKLTVTPALDAHDCVTAMQIMSPSSIADVLREVQGKEAKVTLKDFVEEDCITFATSLVVKAVCDKLPKGEVPVTVKPNLHAKDSVRDIHMAPPRVIEDVGHKMKKEEVTLTDVSEALECVQAAQIVSSWVHGDVWHDVPDVHETLVAVSEAEDCFGPVQITLSLAEEIVHPDWWKKKALLTLKPVLEAKECVTVVQMVSPGVRHEIQKEEVMLSTSPVFKAQNCVQALQIVSSWTFVGKVQGKRYHLTLMTIFETHDFVPDAQMASLNTMEDVWLEERKRNRKLTVTPFLAAQNFISAAQMSSPWVLEDIWREIQNRKEELAVVVVLESQGCSYTLLIASPCLIEDVGHEVQKKAVMLTEMAIVEAHKCAKKVKMVSHKAIENVWHTNQTEEGMSAVTPMLEVQDYVAAVRIVSPCVMEDVWFEVQKNEVELTVTSPVLEAQDCVTSVQISSPWVLDDVWHKVKRKKVNLSLTVVSEARDHRDSKPLKIASVLFIKRALHEIQKRKVKVSVIIVKGAQVVSHHVMEDVWRFMQKEQRMVAIRSILAAQDCVTAKQLVSPWVVEDVWRGMKRKKVNLIVMGVLEAQGSSKAVQIASPWLVEDALHEVPKKTMTFTVIVIVEAQKSVKAVQMANKWVMRDVFSALKVQMCVAVVQNVSSRMLEVACHEVQIKNVLETVAPIFELQDCLTAVQSGSTWVKEDLYHEVQGEIASLPPTPEVESCLSKSADRFSCSGGRADDVKRKPSQYLCTVTTRIIPSFSTLIKKRRSKHPAFSIPLSTHRRSSIADPPHCIIPLCPASSLPGPQSRSSSHGARSSPARTRKHIRPLMSINCFPSVSEPEPWSSFDPGQHTRAVICPIIRPLGSPDKRLMPEEVLEEVQGEEVMATVRSIFNTQDCVTVKQRPLSSVMEDGKDFVSQSAAKSFCSGTNVQEVGHITSSTPSSHTPIRGVSPTNTVTSSEPSPSSKPSPIPTCSSLAASPTPADSIRPLCPELSSVGPHVTRSLSSALPPSSSQTSCNSRRSSSRITEKHIRPLMSVKCSPPPLRSPVRPLMASPIPTRSSPATPATPADSIRPLCPELSSVGPHVTRPLSSPLPPSSSQTSCNSRRSSSGITEKHIRPLMSVKCSPPPLRSPVRPLMASPIPTRSSSATPADSIRPLCPELSSAGSHDRRPLSSVFSPSSQTSRNSRPSSSGITKKHIRPLMSIKCSPPEPNAGPCSSFNPGQHIRPLMPPVRSQTSPTSPLTPPVRPLMPSVRPPRSPVRPLKPSARRSFSPRQAQGIVPSLPVPLTAPTPHFYQGKYSEEVKS